MKRKAVAKAFEVQLKRMKYNRRWLESARQYLLHSKKGLLDVFLRMSLRGMHLSWVSYQVTYRDRPRYHFGQ